MGRWSVVTPVYLHPARSVPMVGVVTPDNRRRPGPPAPVWTRSTVPRVPNQPKTPVRGVRVDDDLWLAAKHEAKLRGENLSEVIRRALEVYIAESRRRRGRSVRQPGEDR